MRARYVIIILLVLAAAVFGLERVWTMGRPDASKILLESAKRTHHIDYFGLVENSANYYGKELKSLTRVYHKGGGERMEYLSQPVKGMVVVGDHKHMFAYRPHADKVLVTTIAAQTEEESRAKLLLKNYTAHVAGTDTVAGRPTVVIDVTPKREGNPSKRMWIDKETYLVLKQEDRSAGGALKSRTVFKEIRYSADMPASKFGSPTDEDEPQTMVMVSQPMDADALSKELGFKVVRPGYVPNGYRFVGYQIYRCQCDCPHDAAHISYTDGLNSISVFETNISVPCAAAGGMDDCGGHGRSHECKVDDSRQGQLGRRVVGNKSVVVIADLPQDQIERITKSIR